MKKFRILSAVLAVLILAMSFTVGVSALTINQYTTSSAAYANEEAKVATMESVYKSEEYGYEMYFDRLSGEFAIKDLKTGEYVFSNPYDVNVNTSMNDLQKQALLSQLMIRYTDTTNGAVAYMSSFASAALLGDQIIMKKLPNGIRVEYAIGTVEAKRLVPRWIEKTRFDEKIMSVLESKKNSMTTEEQFAIEHMFDAYYNKIDPTDPNIPATILQSYFDTYKCLADDPTMVIYVLKDSTAMTLKRLENLIRNYCPEYTFDELETDHQITGYEGEDKEPPLFRLAIEYTFDENGFKASIPAKSIRYNETNYTLDSIVMLPYFGCSTVKEVSGKKTTDGYLFLPDGSGTILEYFNADGTVKTGAQAVNVYGIDYAYQDLTNYTTSQNAETCRFPVYGLADYYDVYTETARSGRPNRIDYSSGRRGFVAIIEEGESFATITASLGTMLWTGFVTSSCEYNTVYASFSMQQTDNVSLGSGIGSGSSLTTSVDTRYTGNYTIRYMTLSDNKNAVAEPTYVGMALAYRNYLINIDSISKYTNEELKEKIPLYIQSFGSMKVNDTFLTFPVKVTRELTTFADIKTMTEQLEGAGITNIKYILSGFANGTASSSYYPSYVKFNGKVGGNKGFKDLIDYSADKDIEILPNFDFSNMTYTRSGVSLKKHGAVMMSGRYATNRNYDPVYQIISSKGHSNIVSTGAYDYIYSKFSKAYDKFFKKFDNYSGSLAALTLGTDLNSDFDKENPITREESKLNTIEFIASLYNKYNSVLVEGGNAYTVPYVTDIISLPLDNSNYSISTASVPFLGIVLHGCVNYTGKPINMAGDVMYEVLKSIENGASPYFILLYQNTEELKTTNGYLNQYYSVNFQTWGDDVVKYYNMINGAIGGFQNADITSHSFVTALRMNSDEALMLFKEHANAKETVESTSKAYYAAVAEVDRLLSNQMSITEALLVENSAKEAFNAAREKLSLIKSMMKKNVIANVVSVTYTLADGTQKTFIINYNNFDVVIEDDNGNAFTLSASSFVDKKDVVGESGNIASREDVDAYVPSSTELASFISANEALQNAINSGNENSVRRAKETLESLLASISGKTKNVSKVTDNDGNTVYINYATSSVIVKISDTRYEIISAQETLLVND